MNNKKIYKNIDQFIIVNNNKIIKLFIIKFFNIWILKMIAIKLIQNIYNYYKHFIKKNNYKLLMNKEKYNYKIFKNNIITKKEIY